MSVKQKELIGVFEPSEVLKKSELEKNEQVSVFFAKAFQVLESIFNHERLVRKVGPGEKPESRHEFERVEFREKRGPGRPIF